MHETLNYPTTEELSTRDGFGEGLVEIGRKDHRVVVLSADLTESTRVHWFQEAYPDRFIEVGVAEQNAVTIAAGLAAEGKIPFVASYGVFSPGRNWEQIRTTICYNAQPVKIIGSHGGLSANRDGASHQALEDIALMRVLPNMAVVIPADYVEARKAVAAVVNHPGPVYLRLNKGNAPVFTTGETPFAIGVASVLRAGQDITVVATGRMVYQALRASETLAQQEISVEVINLSTIKPLDQEALLKSIQKTQRVITIEEHQRTGGVGSAVAELISEQLPVPVLRLGVDDRFGQSGSEQELLQEYGLQAETIVQAAKDLMVESAEMS